MTTNAFGIVGINISAETLFVLLDPENCILWTKNDTVVALKAHAAAHTTVCLGADLLFGQGNNAFIEMPKNRIRSNRFIKPTVSGFILPMTEKQLV